MEMGGGSAKAIKKKKTALPWTCSHLGGGEDGKKRGSRKAVLALSRQGSGRSPLWPQVATQGTAGKEEERCACPGTGKESK